MTRGYWPHDDVHVSCFLPGEICEASAWRKAERTKEPKPMTSQKSERDTVPKARRKSGPSSPAQGRGGKVAPVSQQSDQPGLFDAPADNRPAVTRDRADDEAVPRRRGSATIAVPLASSTDETGTTATMANVIVNLDVAFQNGLVQALK